MQLKKLGFTACLSLFAGMMPLIGMSAQANSPRPLVASENRTRQVGQTDQVERWFEEGKQRLDAGKPAEALVLFEKALNVDANYVNAWIGKGYALYDLERFPEAFTLKGNCFATRLSSKQRN